MRKKILSTTIDIISYKLLLKKAENRLTQGRITLICPIASYTITKAFFSPEISSALHLFDFIVPDSQWVRIFINSLFHTTIKERIYGPDLMKKMSALAHERHYPVYLYGTTPQTLTRLKHQLDLHFPGLKMGAQRSIFRTLSDTEIDTLSQQIIKERTKILFIGIGSPAQEILAANLKKRFLLKNYGIIIITVGAAFDFISGKKPQAPKWIGNIGFEWLFRLGSEPKRLWKRYLILGPLFILLVLGQSILVFITRAYSNTTSKR